METRATSLIKKHDSNNKDSKIKERRISECLFLVDYLNNNLINTKNLSTDNKNLLIENLVDFSYKLIIAKETERDISIHDGHTLASILSKMKKNNPLELPALEQFYNRSDIQSILNKIREIYLTKQEAKQNNPTPAQAAAAAAAAKANLLDFQKKLRADIEKTSEEKRSSSPMAAATKPATATNSSTMTQAATVIRKEESALFNAINKDDKDTAFKLLKTYAKRQPPLVNAIEEKTGRTALHVAAATGNIEILNYLVAFGANVNAKAPKTNFTPLDTMKKYYEQSQKDLTKEKKAIEGMRLLIKDNSTKNNLSVDECLALKLYPYLTSKSDTDIVDLLNTIKQEKKSEVKKLFTAIDELAEYGISLLEQGKTQKDQKKLDAGWGAYHCAVELKEKAMDSIKNPTPQEKEAFDTAMKEANKTMSTHRDYGKKALTLLKNIARCFGIVFAFLKTAIRAAQTSFVPFSEKEKEKRKEALKNFTRDYFPEAKTTRQEKLGKIGKMATNLFGPAQSKNEDKGNEKKRDHDKPESKKHRK